MQNEEGAESTNLNWIYPVNVMFGHGLADWISGPEQALTYLKQRWPANRGLEYSRACELCKKAVDGIIAAEPARDAFITAVIKAGILSV